MIQRFTAFWSTIVLALVAGAPMSAAAQTLFFDDFDDNALQPHWFQPPASHWEYNVSNGMLNVTGLFSPSSPKSNVNYTSIAAQFAAQSDFQVDVWMGWEANQQPHRLELNVLGPFGANPVLASMGYRYEISAGPSPIIYAGAGGSGPALHVPAPPPGIHHFTIYRTGSNTPTGPLFSFYLNGNFVASFQDNFGVPAAYVGFFFLGPYPGQFTGYHIDRVHVVPACGALPLFVPLALVRSRRRRS